MKRLFDLSVTLCLLVVLSPILLGVTVLVYLIIGKPIFFTQDRPGLKGKIFKIYKYRTMKEAFDVRGIPLPDNERLTSFGKLLRSTSIDELPALWNVLNGEMSLVGPRPLLVEYLSLYTREQARRHTVKPGVTGWAQVNGRNAINWEEKFTLDVWYVDNQTFWLDLKIIFSTVIKVFSRSNISHDGHSTMPHFTGSNKP